EFFSWSAWKYVFNPTDPGSSAWHLARLSSIDQQEDGIFYDSYGSGGMSAGANSLEFSSSAWQGAIVQDLLNQKAAFPNKVIDINEAAYFNASQFDTDMINAS